MDSDTLDTYIQNKYPGKAFYITFDDSTLDQALIRQAKGGCDVGTNDVYRTGVHTVSSNQTVQTVSGDKIATVTQWDPSWKRFIINSMSTGIDFEDGDTVHFKDGSLVKAIGKVWKKSVYAQTVSRFIDDNKNTLNPLGSYSGTVQAGTDIQKTAIVDSTATGACTTTVHKLLPFENTLLGAYMEVSGVSNQSIQWVTNYEAEQEINDAKRSIRLLRPEVIADVVTQFEEMISS